MENKLLDDSDGNSGVKEGEVFLELFFYGTPLVLLCF